MNVAVQDLHTVITAAHSSSGGKVVLGGHSLGGSVVTAYATWDFSGQAGRRRPGRPGLHRRWQHAHRRSPPHRRPQQLQALDQPSASPWLAFGGITAPYAGLFNATGSAAALLDPNAALARPDLGAPARPPSFPPVRVTNAGQYGYALNAGDVALEPARGPGPPGPGPGVGRARPRLERRRERSPRSTASPPCSRDIP